MNISSIDNARVEIVRHGKIISEITHMALNGSNFEIEGYATMEGLYSYYENRIRKMVLFIPNLNIEALRSKNLELLDKTDAEILESMTIKVPLDNYPLYKINARSSEVAESYKETLSGFKGTIDLATIDLGKPLLAGDYRIFVSFEQLDDANDLIKYEKVLPLFNSRQFLDNSIWTTRLAYHSPTFVVKYSLIASFDKYSKTLTFKNTVLQSYDPRKLAMDDKNKEHPKVRGVKNRLFQFLYALFCVLPVKKNKVVFASDSREELNGNFFFVYEELLRREMKLDIKFVFSSSIDQKKSIGELIGRAYHFASAKIILLDDFYPMIYPLTIRPNADLIQIWHAAGAFKTFGFSRLGRPGGPSPKSLNHRNYTKAAVSSEGVRGNYADGFGITEDKVHATGLPRADIFFDEEYKDYVRTRLYEKYPILKEKKVILFAPTFRGNGQSSAHYPFEHLKIHDLYKELGDDYVFLLKIHPFVKNKMTIPYEYSNFFIDFSDYREINDLLLVTDVLITDYSSVCFEFALLNKPMLFFAFDVEEYIATRDFYYDFFEFIPGPLLRTTEEIISTIKTGNFETEKIPPFVKYFFDDTLGKASQNVVDQLIIPSLNDEMPDIEKERIILPPAKSRKELFDRTLEVE